MLRASDRALAVLSALLSFHPDSELSSEGGLVVFPSNRQLSLRAHGMAPATLRRHLAVLVECRLVVRRDTACPGRCRCWRRSRGSACRPNRMPKRRSPECLHRDGTDIRIVGIVAGHRPDELVVRLLIHCRCRARVDSVAGLVRRLACRIRDFGRLSFYLSYVLHPRFGNADQSSRNKPLTQVIICHTSSSANGGAL